MYVPVLPITMTSGYLELTSLKYPDVNSQVVPRTLPLLPALITDLIPVQKLAPPRKKFRRTGTTGRRQLGGDRPGA